MTNESAGVDSVEIPTMLDSLSASLGDESVIAIVDVFREVSHKQINTMEQATVNNSVEQLRQQAHSLKSSAANLGAMKLAELCATIEKATSVTPEIAEIVEQAKLCQTLAVENMLNWRTAKS